MFTLFFLPHVLASQQTLKMSRPCQIKEESALLGLFPPSHPVAQSLLSPFSMKASPAGWALNLSVEKRSRLKKDMGQVMTQSSSPVLCLLWQKGLSGGLQCFLGRAVCSLPYMTLQDMVAFGDLLKAKVGALCKCSSGGFRAQTDLLVSYS